MNVNGTVGLGGNLVVTFVNGFQNSVSNSNTFTVLSSTTTLSGTFANVASGTRLNTSDSSGSFLVTYSGSNIVLSDFMTGAFGPANTFVVNTAGPITVASDLESVPSRNAGTVELSSTAETVTVNSRIEVAPAKPSRRVASTHRRNAKQANIDITSGKTTGVAINVSSSAQLLALLNAAAPGPGGTITIKATSPTSNSSSINVNGTVQADRGTIDIEHAGDSGQINLSNASLRADIVKIGALGTNGALTIGGGSITADTLLKLYAPSSNGILNFIANVTLSSGTAANLAANTITIQPSVIVTIAGAGGPANVYTNNPNYSNFGGSNPSNGTFGGNGANNPRPLPSAPPFGQGNSPTRHRGSHF
jgi:hypothetical protein